MKLPHKSLPLSSLGLALCLTGPTQAVTIDGANQTVNSLGTYIEDWVNELGQFRQGGGQTTPDENALEALCNDYLSEARGVSEGTPEQRQAVIAMFEDLAHEEVGALGSGFTDTGQELAGNVVGRLQTIRGGSTLLASHSVMLGQTGGAAGDDFSRLGVYSNFTFGSGDKDTTTNERGFDFDSQALTFGADYRYKDGLVAGAALGFGSSEVDMEGTEANSDGNTISLTFYATTFQDNWYIDASLGYALHDYDNSRRVEGTVSGTTVNQTLTSSPDGDSLSLSVGAGFTHQMGQWTGDYALRVNSVMATIDSYSESGGTLALNVGKQEVDSLQGILAAQFSKAYSSDNGVLVPSLGLEIHQEFDDDTRVVSAQYVLDRFNNQFSFTSDDADSTFYLLNAGTSWVMSQGRQLFVNWDHIVGLSDVNSNTITAGFRMEL